MITLNIGRDTDPKVRIAYNTAYVTFGPRHPKFYLMAEGNIWIEPGCSGTIPHGLFLLKSDVQVYIMPTMSHLVNSGLLIEVHPVVVDNETELVTTVFNMSTERKAIQRKEVYSYLTTFQQETIWDLKYNGVGVK